MAYEKMYDLAVVIGEYKDGQGNTKKRWCTIGSMFQGDHAPFIVLQPHINIGALPRGAKGDVLVSCFEPKPKTESTHRKEKSHAPDYDDDIPF